MSNETMTHDYYELIKREHHELGVALHDTEAAFEARPRDIAAIQIAVEHLFQLLESHFTHEEEGGFLHEAIERAPRVSRRASELLEQHAALRSAIASLREQVSSADAESRTWDKSHGMFIALMADLGKHESGENALLQEAYTEDIGTKD